MAMKIAHADIPQEVLSTLIRLQENGHKAYIVGGCVRDLLLRKKPKDWDITTSATPEKIVALYKHTFYENTFGTVGVVTEEFQKDPTNTDKTVAIIEITPFRLESEYTDGRRPDAVTFSKDILDDLKRRDFTINSIAYNPNEQKNGFIDPHNGVSDLEKNLIRAVGNASIRFKEDGLRLMRAVRIACEHDFTIETETEKAIRDNAKCLANISQERIRDEVNRILLSKRPKYGLELLKDMGLMEFIIPELLAGVGVEQNQAHAFDVWEHLLRSLQCAADKKYPLEVRIAALLHDISKPETRRFDKEKGEYTFYGHEVVGERVSRKILERLHYSNDTIEEVTKLIRWHMFFSDTEQISLSAVRRMINNVGKDRIWDLMDLRICDRIGTGRPKESPYRLRKYHSMIEEALRDPITVGMLKIDGNILIKELNMAPGPKIGAILHALLEEVLENPALNTKEYLAKRSNELSQMEEKELIKLGKAGKESKEKADQELIEEIRKKHWVK